MQISANSVRPRIYTWVWNGSQATACVGALCIIILATGALRDPTESLHGLLGSAIWTTFGPHLVLVSGFALILGVVGHWRRVGVLSMPTTMTALIAFFASTAITARIVSAAYEAGGYANPLSGLWLTPMTGNEADSVMEFARRDGLPLNAAIYRPVTNNGDAPVIVYIHGGGFKVGSILETSADLRWFAERGWLVISIDYRLWTDKEPTWDKATQDVSLALTWAMTQAPAYGGDSSRLVLLGDSAGGNLAINVAYAAAAGLLQTEDGESVPVPKAVVTQYPAVDPLSIYEHGYPVSGFEPKWLMSGYIGGDPYDLSDRVRAVSSYSYLTENAPATLIIEPEKDGLVPSWSVYRFADHARLAGVDIELVRIPFASHVYNQIASNSIGNQARLSITERYLKEKGLSP